MEKRSGAEGSRAVRGPEEGDEEGAAGAGGGDEEEREEEERERRRQRRRREAERLERRCVRWGKGERKWKGEVAEKEWMGRDVARSRCWQSVEREDLKGEWREKKREKKRLAAAREARRARRARVVLWGVVRAVEGGVVRRSCVRFPATVRKPIRVFWEPKPVRISWA